MKRYADHIMVGYRFRKEGGIVQGAVNDKEYYGDQEVLTAILKAQAVNVAVFVAREYGGISTSRASLRLYQGSFYRSSQTDEFR